jgi:peptidoglycan/xylan/chitin deacetylase (PgdA/CDA1 family)
MKKLFLICLCAIGLHRFAAWWNRKRVIILCYHGVTDNSNRYPHNTVGQDIHRDAFAAHLDYLRSRYRIISLDEYLTACSTGATLPDYSVVLTFDDGCRNIATVAASLLAQRAIPYTVFVITDTLSASEVAGPSGAPAESDDARYLSWTEARELERTSLVKFESHTCSHPDLLCVSAEQVARELVSSREAIRANLGRESRILAYPYGHFSEKVAEQAKDAGYLSAITIEDGPNDTHSDLHTLRRMVISNQDQGLLFAARVSGLIWWLSLIRIKFLRVAHLFGLLFHGETGMRIEQSKVSNHEDVISS